MLEKKELLNDIKSLWNKQKIKDFDIAPELLEYLEIKDLENLKAKILNSLENLTEEQKKWLSKFRKE